MSQVILTDDLERKILADLPAQYCKATDESEDACGSKFLIVVVSDVFAKKPMLAQHRMIHKVIEEERKSIHALTLKTYTPESWEKEKGEPVPEA